MSRRLCGDAFLLAAGVSVVLSALVAVSSDLHLFGDGSWYLLNLAATRRYAYWIGDWPTQFFQSRIGDYLVTQTPVLVAIHLGVHSLRALSKIYGISLWLAVLLPVWICLRLSRSPLDRLFPVIGLIAGTMNGAAFLVAESHLVAAFYWAILFLLLFGDERSTGRTRLLVALSAPLLLCYESMLFFGVILALVCLDRRRTAATGGPLYLGLAAWHLVAAALAAAAILWPFDPTNRQGFLAAMIGLLTRSDHLGAQVSIVCL
ncbi:MAG: hypothetical protein QOD06_3436, partial [Candidatus Binatota bacterium]|nr:hypothetical protein [Candidatus Binatota bacterium]